MKAIGIVLLIAAVAIAVVPQFTDCESQGRALTLQNGKTVPMKCHWTAQASLGLALPLAVVGAITTFSRRKANNGNLGIVGVGLGALTILLPTTLIGVCASPDMLCNSVMLPFLVLIGIIVTAVSGLGFALSFRATRAAAKGQPEPRIAL